MQVWHVCFWLHETDMPTALRNVRYQGQSGKHVLALSFSGFDPLQACPIMSGQGSRSQPGEKLRLLCCEFFRRENAFLVQFGQPLDFGEEVRFLGTVGPIRLAGRRHPWFRSLGLHAVYRGDRQSSDNNCPMLAGKGKRAAAPLSLSDAASLVVYAIVD